MSAMTDFLEQGLRDHFKSDTQLPLEDTYLALLTADPTDTGSTVSEIGSGWYARQQVYPDTATATNTPYWVNATAGVGIENNSAVTFPTSTAGTHTVTYMALMDAATGGNMLLKTAVNTSKQVKNGDTAKFNAGDVSFTFT